MSHGWFVLLMALAVIVVVAFFATVITIMVRAMGGWQTLGIWAAAIIVEAAILLIIFAATGLLSWQ